MRPNESLASEVVGVGRKESRMDEVNDKIKNLGWVCTEAMPVEEGVEVLCTPDPATHRAAAAGTTNPDTTVTGFGGTADEALRFALDQIENYRP